MFIAAAIVSALFAALLVLSAFGKLTHEKGQAATLARVGATRIVPLLAVIELAAAVGLLIGLVWSPLGVAAAIGLVLYFAGAITAHLRVGDRAFQQPVILMLVAAVTLALRLFAA